MKKNSNYPKIAEILKESLDRKVISLSLDEYESMKEMIEYQAEKIRELRNEKEPVFHFQIVVSTQELPSHDYRKDYLMGLANQFGLGYHMMYARLKAEEVSDNPTMNAIREMVDEKLRQAKSFEESALEMLEGIRRQRQATEEALKRAPWWCRWAIKPKTNEKGS